MMQLVVPVDAEILTAEQLLATVVSWDLMISNLGVQHLAIGGPIAPTAVWGPVLNTQIDGDHVTGVLTYQGRLRMVGCGYTPTADYLENLAATHRKFDPGDRFVAVEAKAGFTAVFDMTCQQGMPLLNRRQRVPELILSEHDVELCAPAVRVFVP